MSAYQSARLVCLGESPDQRTNRWRVTCPHCSKEFEPPTTMHGREILTCPRPKCLKSMLADYNSALDDLGK